MCDVDDRLGTNGVQVRADCELLAAAFKDFKLVMQAGQEVQCSDVQCAMMACSSLAVAV
jgi:hypothetical protein